MFNKLLKTIQNFISALYLRYLLVTELYMVEPWEKVVIHVVFAVLFAGFWYFNHSIIVRTISDLRSSTTYTQDVL